jgi:hypothetical protein
VLLYRDSWLSSVRPFVPVVINTFSVNDRSV